MSEGSDDQSFLDMPFVFIIEKIIWIRTTGCEANIVIEYK